MEHILGARATHAVKSMAFALGPEEDMAAARDKVDPLSHYLGKVRILPCEVVYWFRSVTRN